MTRYTLKVAVSALALALPLAGYAHGARHAGTMSEPTMSRDAARTVAAAQVQGGTIQDTHLEKMHGKLVWAFDVASPHAGRLTRVLIDADNGKILSAHRERAQRHEARAHAGQRHS